MNTTYPPAYFKAILEKRPLSPKLADDVGDAFRVMSLRGRLYDHTLLGFNATCARPDNRVALLLFLTSIVDC